MVELWKSAPVLRMIAIKVLSQTTSSLNCEINWRTFSFIHTKPRNKLTMEKLNKLVYIHYNLKLQSKNRRRAFKDQQDYFCLINLETIFFSAKDYVLGEWLEEVEEPLLDKGPELAQLVNELTGERRELMKASEILHEINMT